ncbi:DUF4232 domain-containing protein [Streptomyces rhizosphaerihabitans]|uniref:DUF4232 domain-containing protein n=1 Tax=Streptomyces rhizosphaerihabitans TaxID=1266770 RepID=UPI0021BE072B|nr:DUF4232 domain-containing protein [Streptomyces rhizosphaerihabitans]MCT9010145.1 DUF4232 domain-containing protein [Streptomyces rhizosphaerihabitans]
MSTIRNRTTLLTATTTALLALALTACGPDGSGTKSSGPETGGTAQDASATASAANTGSTTGTTGGSSTSKSSTGSGSKSASGSKSGSGSGTTTGAGGGNATSDSYAYKHPCSGGQVSVNVTTRDGASSQRVIAVRNNGASSCGLSYYPRVYLDQASAQGGKNVKPLIPSGLGGAPAYPVYAGQTAYAVIDVDPSGATTGTVSGIDELNVLADGDHMPNADTHNFPLGSGALVLKPKLGLYRSTIADAVSSMKAADTQS